MFVNKRPRPLPRKHVFRWALLVAFGFFIWAALFLTVHGELNADEGFYLAASRLVESGQRLYRDFGFTQGPVLPYANLLWHAVFGYTFAGERLAACAWTVIAVIVGTIWLKKYRSIEAGLVFLILLCGTPSWLALAVKGKTYAFAGLCVLLGSIAMSSNSRWWMRWGLFIGSAACGVGARYPALAFYLPGTICLWVRTSETKGRAAGLLCLLVLAGVEMSWAASGGWENFFFWTADFHLQSSFVSPLGPRLWECFLIAPGLWVGLAALLAFNKVSLRSETFLLLGCLVIACIANIGPHTAYAEYLAPFVPSLAWAVSPPIAEWMKNRHLLQYLMGGACIITPSWLFWSPPLTRDILVSAAQASAFLRANTSPEFLVAASMPEIPIGADRRVPLTLAMGKFAMTEDYAADVARRRRMLTPDLYCEQLRDQRVAAIVLSRGPEWNFSWSVPSYRSLSSSGRTKIAAAIQSDFAVAYANDHYLVLLRRVPASR